MRLLLFSNSTNAREEFLTYTLPYINEFLNGKTHNAVFIPYASVSINWNMYYQKVRDKLESVGIQLTSIHTERNKKKALEKTDLIIVGGGNTFNLLKNLQDEKLLGIIKNQVCSGTPYIGWSAGSNICCPTICTTNDMPIVEPQTFNSLGLVPFQINPHYTNIINKNHNGESRDMRIAEFLIANRGIYVAALPEATFLLIEENRVQFCGEKPCRIFKSGKETMDLYSYNDFSFLMQ